MKTKGYYKISNKIAELEEKVEIIDIQAKDIMDNAKKMKKGSEERKEAMAQAKALKEDREYQDMKLELKTLYFCLNSVYYN